MTGTVHHASHKTHSPVENRPLRADSLTGHASPTQMSPQSNGTAINVLNGPIMLEGELGSPNSSKAAFATVLKDTLNELALSADGTQNRKFEHNQFGHHQFELGPLGTKVNATISQFQALSSFEGLDSRDDSLGDFTLNGTPLNDFGIAPTALDAHTASDVPTASGVPTASDAPTALDAHTASDVPTASDIAPNINLGLTSNSEEPLAAEKSVKGDLSLEMTAVAIPTQGLLTDANSGAVLTQNYQNFQSSQRTGRGMMYPHDGEGLALQTGEAITTKSDQHRAMQSGHIASLILTSAGSLHGMNNRAFISGTPVSGAFDIEQGDDLKMTASSAPSSLDQKQGLPIQEFVIKGTTDRHQKKGLEKGLQTNSNTASLLSEGRKEGVSGIVQNKLLERFKGGSGSHLGLEAGLAPLSSASLIPANLGEAGGEIDLQHSDTLTMSHKGEKMAMMSAGGQFGGGQQGTGNGSRANQNNADLQNGEDKYFSEDEVFELLEGDDLAELIKTQQTVEVRTKSQTQQPSLARDVAHQLGYAIKHRTDSSGGDIRVKLNPVELGEVRIRLQLDNNVVRATISVESEKALKLLSHDIKSLLGAWKEMGVDPHPEAVEFILMGEDADSEQTEFNHADSDGHNGSERDDLNDEMQGNSQEQARNLQEMFDTDEDGFSEATLFVRDERVDVHI